MSPALRDRLPSALIALALQAGLFALLVFSFEAVRLAGEEKETTLTLAPMRRPMPAPMTIDARGRERPETAVTPPPVAGAAAIAAPPAIAAPGGNTIQAAPAPHAQADCPLQAGAVAGVPRVCPPTAQADETEELLHPNHRVKDEDYYAAEKAQRDAPFMLPGAGAGPLGILLTALFNPGAFADKHNYNGGPPLPPRDGDVASASRKSPPQHASDDAFKAALKAVNDRNRALYSKTVPAPDAQAGPAP